MQIYIYVYIKVISGPGSFVKVNYQLRQWQVVGLGFNLPHVDLDNSFPMLLYPNSPSKIGFWMSVNLQV